tara:strand:+ start:598 stop:852 length:255 start_codon:yes stop_codon:yes gene_type:complete
MKETNPTEINKRLFDLVRYSRFPLYEEGLITDAEYAWLVSNCDLAKGKSSPSPRRLEDYDDLRARLDEMDELILQQRVDEERES